MQRSGIKSNIRKYFLIELTGRRNFIPILSIYYLSLPDATAQQIGMYTAIGSLASIIFQIPAGYIGDKRGNKVSLVISKASLVLSSLAFVIGNDFRFFVAGSFFLSLGVDAFFTGNASAFLHDTLTELKKPDTFKKIASQIKGWVSLTSIFFIITLPLFISINMKLPFEIALGIDMIGFIVARSLYPVQSHYQREGKLSNIKDIPATLKATRNTGFYSIALFSALIPSFLIADGVFRSPYLQELGYPIIRIGLVMGGSRLIRFIVGQYAHQIEKYIRLKYLMLAEIILFSGYYFSITLINNPFVAGTIFALVIGYFRGRSSIYTDHLITILPHKHHKATMLSVRGLANSVFQIILIFGIGFVMTRSYKLGFMSLGILLFISLSLVYIFFLKETKNKNF